MVLRFDVKNIGDTKSPRPALMGIGGLMDKGWR